MTRRYPYQCPLCSLGMIHLAGKTDGIAECCDACGASAPVSGTPSVRMGPPLKYTWDAFRVTGYPSHTIGAADGDTLENNLPVKLAKLEADGWEIFGVNVVSSTLAFITVRKRS